MDAAAPRTRVVLKPRRALPFYARHPWVYAGAIERVEGEPTDADEVDVISSTGQFVARGLINRQSKIQVRLYTWDETQPLDEHFFRTSLEQALSLRQRWLKLDAGTTSAYRVVFSKADGLSGMIVDRYGDWAALQLTSLALAARKEMLGRLLMDMLGLRGVYLRTEKGIGKLEGLKLQDGHLCGEPPPQEIVVREGPVQFAIHLQDGQKTGFYLDQRDNRVAVARSCQGRRFLDTFSYSGGFGITAAAAGAAEVTCIDASEAALRLAQRNAELNGLTQVRTEAGDVFRKLDEYVAAGRAFDVVVLDPPKFARGRSSVPDALRGYRRLYTQGLKLLPQGGLLVLCCCSGLVTYDMLEELMAQCATKARRVVQILERRGSAADHPVSLACPEGAYLKCFITRVI